MQLEPLTCHATTRSGAQCRTPPMHGQQVCRMHGGSSPQALRKASERVVEQQARTMLSALGESDPVDDPYAALLDIASQAKAFADIMRDQVVRLEELRYSSGMGLEQIRAEVQVYLSALTRAESVISSVIKLDLDTRRLRLREAQVQAIILAVDRMLTSPELELDPIRQRRGRELLARALGAPAAIEV